MQINPRCSRLGPRASCRCSSGRGCGELFNGSPGADGAETSRGDSWCSAHDLLPRLTCSPSCSQHMSACSHPNAAPMAVFSITFAFDHFCLTAITTRRALTEKPSILDQILSKQHGIIYTFSIREKSEFRSWKPYTAYLKGHFYYIGFSFSIENLTRESNLWS